MAMIEHALAEKFIYPEHVELLRIANTPEQLIRSLEDFQIPENLGRWVNREEKSA